jgi:flagellar hook-associated protein 3 FlgL
MRISTSAIYDANVSMLNQQQAKLLHTQQQLASGRRMLTPADDPIASARALEVSQSDASNTQYATNRNSVKSSTALSESILDSVTLLLQDVRTSAVQAGGGTMTPSDKKTVATVLTRRLEELQSLANSTDGVGNFLYSGYQGRTQPFANSAGGVQYMADDGQRMVQVSSSRQLAGSDSGADIFMRIKNGNGTFIVQPDPTSNAGAGNSGTGIVSQGTVTNPALLTGNNYQVTFNVAVIAGVTTTTYDVYNSTTAPAPALSTGNAYVSGQAINVAGMQFDVTGTPANGDAFSLAPSTNESIFKTVSDLIATMGTTSATFNNNLNKALNKLDRDLDNVLTVRGSLGSRLTEIDALNTTGDDLGLNFKATLSQLQDVDYNKGISDLNQQQLSLTAAQKSFQQISGLSLFNYL